MSTSEVTPESLRLHADWMDDHHGAAEASFVRRWADDLEREQRRPLPTVPGWYPGIVVERGGESCTGALLADDDGWRTAREVAGRYGHWLDSNPLTTIRWAEQDGKTPGQTAWEAQWYAMPWKDTGLAMRSHCERIAAAVLSAHGTPTLTDAERAEAYCRGWSTCARSMPDLTPVGEHPEPGTRGLLPVVLVGDEWSNPYYDVDSFYVCKRGSEMGGTVLADPRPDGAHE